MPNCFLERITTLQSALATHFGLYTTVMELDGEPCMVAADYDTIQAVKVKADQVIDVFYVPYEDNPEECLQALYNEAASDAMGGVVAEA